MTQTVKVENPGLRVMRTHTHSKVGLNQLPEWGWATINRIQNKSLCVWCI